MGYKNVVTSIGEHANKIDGIICGKSRLSKHILMFEVGGEVLVSPILRHCATRHVLS